MNLFIDTISSPAFLIIFDDNKNIILEFSWQAAMNESSTLIPNISDVLIKNNLSFLDIKNIVVVNGPGSFTGVRTTTLVVNSIAYLHKDINLTEINYFELFDNYPIIKKSSRRDCFCKLSGEKNIEIIQNEDLQNMNFSEYYGDSLAFLDAKNNSKVDYSELLSKIKLDNLKIVKPFYFKKPNIT